jgi:hypothetical protein
LKNLVFADLQSEAAHERYIQCLEVEKIIEIRDYDDKDAITHQKKAILILNNYVLTHLVILDVVVLKLHTISTCVTELVGS